MNERVLGTSRVTIQAQKRLPCCVVSRGTRGNFRKFTNLNDFYVFPFPLQQPLLGVFVTPKVSLNLQKLTPVSQYGWRQGRARASRSRELNNGRFVQDDILKVIVLKIPLLFSKVTRRSSTKIYQNTFLARRHEGEKTQLFLRDTAVYLVDSLEMTNVLLDREAIMLISPMLNGDL